MAGKIIAEHCRCPCNVDTRSRYTSAEEIIGVAEQLAWEHQTQKIKMNTNQNSDLNNVEPVAPVATPAAGTSPNPGQAQSTQFSFRYAAQIKDIEHCPPSQASKLSVIGYRFAFEEFNHKHNFLPLALIQPERIHVGQPMTQCCTGYSLSVYESLEALKRKAQKVLKNSPQFLSKVGDHFFEMKISGADGICTAPSSTGHFDFFEDKDFSCQNAITKHQRLVL